MKLQNNFFDSLKNRYQNNIESTKSSEFVFDYAHLLYYKCHKLNPNCGGSYIDSPDWLKNKKQKKKAVVVWNYEEIKKDLQ